MSEFATPTYSPVLVLCGKVRKGKCPDPKVPFPGGNWWPCTVCRSFTLVPHPLRNYTAAVLSLCKQVLIWPVTPEQHEKADDTNLFSKFDSKRPVLWMLLFVAMRFKLFGRESGWASYFLYLTVPFALCKGRQECHLNYSCSFAIIVFKILIDFGKGAGYILSLIHISEPTRH